ncbi:glycerol-3-phosphate dehydrogenase/oxidase [Demequina sp. TTPB684]|uniref:glycerol-3-phosphate dehydrogenase/oxidase n=1 Tax=unclassified Demequina TaxID=2620311 RepID=UPI001CF21C82|nr:MULTISPECIES: glycerol-3-phosphate dehydrogenase/oxidase [unclassified Demequina]MCB2412883.1 glycerol-3-phosphate dehydrogenase/oxidase [Demequina sp. TTPB684]UPU88139.1 glycerol-3-phosphate dehydrogenase/oxidase [Demequina sp. TMPB413]
MRILGRSRSETRREVEALRARPHTSVLVIGGGINGISVFRDLALQGVDVALVERGDLAAETSAASSRMIHGGLRYLEYGEFRLVRESVEERNHLLAAAPHHVRPLATTIPIRTVFGGLVAAPMRFLTGRSPRHRTQRGALLVKAGLTLYDAYSRIGRAPDGTGVPRHHFAGPRRTRRELPDLHPDTLFTATYFDAAVHAPERLALEVSRDGLEYGPAARLATYVSAVGTDDGSVMLRDEVTGDRFPMRADVVVNASGPFTDLTNEALGTPTSYMGGTKGSHLVLDHPELLRACHGREIFFENADGRIVLVYPMGGRVIVGTTDIPADPREPAVCTEEEVDYFIELTTHVFPHIRVTRDHIVYRFAGIRPLALQVDAEPGRMSRDYAVRQGSLPGAEDVAVFSIVGGKWTTFRALGEQVADRVLDTLGLERAASTAGRVIGGGVGLPPADDRDEWIAHHLAGVTPERGRVLVARYGTRAADVADAEAGTAALRTAPGYTRGEIAHLASEEHVVRLSDIALRRTSLAFEGALTLDVLEELADVVGETLRWGGGRRRREIKAVVSEMSTRHGVDVRARTGARA